MAGSEPAQRVRLDKAREAQERRLIQAAQQDRARFVEIYDEYFELVYGYVARRTRNRDEAEDLTAEVFRKALENLSRFKWTGAPFGAWLLRIASNLIADRAKRKAREGNVPIGDSDQRAGESKSKKQTQQGDLEASEQRAQVFRLVDELAKGQRQVVIMRFAEEKSIREIAKQLKRSEGAIKQLQFRALKNLREKLGEVE